MPAGPDYNDDPFELKRDQRPARRNRELLRSSSGRLRALQAQARPSERLTPMRAHAAPPRTPPPPAARAWPAVPIPSDFVRPTPPQGRRRPTPPQGNQRPTPAQGLPRPMTPPRAHHPGAPSSGQFVAVPPPSSRHWAAVPPPTHGHRLTPAHGTPTPDLGATRPSGSRRATGRLDAGTMIDAFQVSEVLGRGSMGRVLRARDPLGREVAIKMILAEVADEEGLIRFQREGQAMAAVPPHHNVVTVHSTGFWHGSPYLVLDYVRGESLDRRLKSGPLPLQQAVEVAERLCAALAHIHASGVHHRDLKPANIMMRAEDDQPVVTDFGMAGLRGADRLTRTGDLLGTPLYMAPEQILGLKDLDGRVDVWALGVLTYELLTGSVPFGGKSLIDVTQAITGKPTPNLLEACPQADASLAGIVGKALIKKPADRYANPEAMRAALAAWLEARRTQTEAPPRPPTTSSARGLWALTILSVLSATIAVLLWTQRKAHPEPVESAAAASPETDARPRRARRAAVEPSPIPLRAEQELSSLAQALELRLETRLREDVRALNMALDGASLDVERAQPLVQGCLDWLTQNLESLSTPAEAGELLELEAPLLALGCLRAACPAALDALPERGRPWATRLAELAAERVKDTTSAELVQAAARLFVALGDSGLRVDADAQASAFLLSEFWASWTLGHEVFPTPLYVGVVRASVQLDLCPRTNHLYGGSTRIVDLESLRTVLREEDAVTSYVDTQLRLGLQGEVAGVAPAATLVRRMRELITSAEAGLGPRNRALALLVASDAAETKAERKQLHERALALSPDDPWVLRTVADFFSAQRNPDPRTADLAEQALARFRDDRHAGNIATGWELNGFLERVATCQARLGNWSRAHELVVELNTREEDGDAAGVAQTLAVLAFERQQLEPALAMLTLTEKLLKEFHGVWLDAEDRSDFAEWEVSLRQTYRNGFRLMLQRERPELARQLVELYRGTGRMEQDEVFLDLSRALDR